MRGKGTVAALAALALALPALSGAARTAGVASAAELALMPLPGAAIGAPGASLALKPDSGIVTNAQEADNLFEEETGAKFAGLGRVAGYQLDYEDETYSAFARGSGVEEIDTEVSLYRDAASAAHGLAFLERDRRDLALGNSASIAMRVTTPATRQLCDSSFGLTVAATPSGLRTIYETLVGVRSGEIAATVDVTGASATSTLAVSLGAALERRIAGVLAGKVTGSPVALPSRPKPGPPPAGTDLSRIAIAAGDVHGSSQLVHQGYDNDKTFDAVSEYVRHLSPAGPFANLTSTVDVYHTATQASYEATGAAEIFGSPAAVKRLFGSNLGSPITRVTSTPLRVTTPDDTRGFVILIGSANGVDLEVDLLALRAGATSDIVVAVGSPGQRTPGTTIAALAKAAARRLG